MPALQRSVSIRGARFYHEGDEVMFVRHLDASTREGPRAATDEDKAAHPDAWAKFSREPVKTPGPQKRKA